MVPGLYAADLRAAGDVPTDWAVVSLCRVGDRFANHPIRREVYLVDANDDHNLDLAAVVGDTVDTIDAFLDKGRKVVVHCHAGQSRTGLILPRLADVPPWLGGADRDLARAPAVAHRQRLEPKFHGAATQSQRLTRTCPARP